MPTNIAGKPIEPADYNRNDGFSPGSPIHTKIPGLDNQAAFERTGLVPETDMQRSFDAGQPAVVIDADSGERQLIWAELDANPASDADRNLFIRPGKNFREGHRYIVALRNLRRADGSAIEPARAFKVYRDGILTTSQAVEARRARMEDLFARLGTAGIARGDLYLAWDFTVGSAQRIAGRMLKLRDNAFAQLGDTNLSDLTVQGDAPAFTPALPCPTADEEDPAILRVCGQFTVPCYLDAPGCPPGSRFSFGAPASNDPVRLPGNTMVAGYECIVRIDASGDARPALYGHGLLGEAAEVDLPPQRAMVKRHDFIYCATDWKGMATEDVPNVATILNDLSRFPTLTDRLQQGLLNFLYLGRLMIHPDGFGSDPALMGKIDTDRLFYDGNSQGGIYGGTLTAIAPDFQRSVLGVPGMNYSTLMQRSTDFGEYGAVLSTSYPRESERPLLFSLIQQLWDRSDPNGYAQHMTTDPYPDTPPHTVLMQSAVGDHQVANVAADVEARTIGARIRAHPVDPGRSNDVLPFYAIGRTAFAAAGSVYEPWDSGAGVNALAPNSNTPPVASPQNQDPHGHPRRTTAAQDQKSEHLRITDSISDLCGNGPCHSE